MRQWIADGLSQLGGWLSQPVAKSVPAPPGTQGGNPMGYGLGFIDAYQRVREPSGRDLLRELRCAAYTCATLNAAVCAAHAPKLYVRTRQGEKKARCGTRPLPTSHPLVIETKGLMQVEEVTEHPLLELFQQVNPFLNHHDLWELTTLYQEVDGNCYWLMEEHGVLGIPSNIWPLPAHQMRTYREPGSPNLLDGYVQTAAGRRITYRPDEIIHFKYPDPADPYLRGLSPLRAGFEDVSLAGQYRAMKRAVVDNHALPGVIISPDEVIGVEERDRIEAQWNQKFRRGGNGKALVAESGLAVDVIQGQYADVAALAAEGATTQDIYNLFGVPVAFGTTETNKANLQASIIKHARFAATPRVRRRDEKLNEQLIPRYDPTGRLFLWTPDVEPEDRDFHLRQEESDLVHAVQVVNEVRRRRGLPEVPWGNVPWVPKRETITDNIDQPNQPNGGGK
jgi:HK97 family phage portal protein